MARDKGTGSVYQLANGKWQGSIEVGWTARGTRRRVTVTRRTKREALAALKAKQRDLAVNGLPAENQHTTTTLKAYADEWLEEQEQRLSPSSFTAARTALTRWIIPTIGHRKLSTLAARDLRAVTNTILKEGRSAGTAARYHVVLVKLLKDAARDGYPITKSALLAESVSVGKPDTTAIDHDHVAAILEQARKQPDYSRWLAAFLAALRPAEARGLTWDRVNFDIPALEISWQLKQLPYKVARDRTSGFRVPRGHESIQIKHSWHLVRPKTKAGDRWIPMHSQLRDELLAWREQCPGDYDLVWPNLTGDRKRAYGGPREDKPDRAVWKQLCRDAGVPEYDLYAARHTAASLLKAEGVSDEIIIAIMGHATIKSTQAYIHTKLADAASELERATQALQLPAR